MGAVRPGWETSRAIVLASGRLGVIKEIASTGGWRIYETDSVAILSPGICA